ncbi:hypothetical protein [Actinobacillus suis]|uniref:Sialyltransferase PMO188 n=2 Tax=Actinobacillus suis TaxID=716 RepID=K0G612_ACTSU|nr:hypothetical protein [Actinobacillus suis]AFU19871.1 hypothetical protein ASU2_08685 [Actinobacillus suis H91-0380]AIJ32009.1 hypothetical protein ASU1_08750 [Actinobacillus suis ATCC 33415]MCO4169776.1 hypothetical protein [Actinobacillus suis]MCQ9630537.1 hypothetical protein [Actinobacillus suis]MCQ9632762.1 hypothetical protein [Actinobacillus suis]
MERTPQLQAVDIYIDFATIPSLSYFLHFLKHKHDDQRLRLFSLARFEMPQTLIEQYEGIIQFSRNVEHNVEPLLEQLQTILSQEGKQFELHLHLNLFHSFEMFLNLSPTYTQYKEKISKIVLHLYDDGSEGVMKQYQLQKSSSLVQDLAATKASLVSLFENGEGSFSQIDLIRYVWNAVLETHYYLLSDHFLLDEKLQPLKAELGHYQLLNLSAYQYLSSEDLLWLKQILKIDTELESLMQKLTAQPVYFFSGTTFFNISFEDKQRLANIHAILIREHLDPNSQLFIGEPYLFVFKGHPNSPEINQALREYYPNVIFLPENIPFEILTLLGFSPQKIGGFASTIHVNSEQSKLAKLFFLTSTDEQERQLSDGYIKQYALAQAMLEMQLVSQEQVYYCSLSS